MTIQIERTRAENGTFAKEDPSAAFVTRTRQVGDCVEWIGRRDENGYGRISSGGLQNVGAHRVAWILANGGIPASLCVLHRCDNPPCVNVAHLFLGTVGDNNRDRSAKGRTIGFAGGEDHPRSKVSSYQVEMMRNLHSRGMRPRQIAEMVGLSRSQVAKIVTGKAHSNAR